MGLSKWVKSAFSRNSAESDDNPKAKPVQKREPYRSSPVKIPPFVSRGDLINIMQELVDQGEVSIRTVNEKIDAVRTSVGKDANLALLPEGSTERRVLEFIYGLDLPPEYKEKLREMLDAKNYARAVKAAKELDAGCKAPPLSQIANEIMKYDEKKLLDICEMMEKPKLIIVPDNSFDEKIEGMNEHRHYISEKDGKPQDELSHKKNLGHPDTSPYLKAPVLKKSKVSIADGVCHPKKLEHDVKTAGKRLRFFVGKYHAKKMLLIDKDEYLSLLQQSLIEAEECKDNRYIIDHAIGEGQYTTTILNPDSLAKTKFDFIGGVNLPSHMHKPDFQCIIPDNDSCNDLMGRAALMVIEF